MQALVSHTTLLDLCSDNASRLDVPKIFPSPASGPEASSSGQTADRLLALLISSAVRKGSLEKMHVERCYPDLLRAIHRCVQGGRPVQLTLMAFPFKVPNPAKVGPRRLPDLAELAALVRLHQLNAKAKSIYPPGLEIHLIHDGSYIAGVFRVALEEVRCYENYFAQLVRALGMGQFIHVYDFESLLALCVSDCGPLAARLRESTLNWRSSVQDTEEWKDRFSKTLGMINLRSLPMSEVCRLLDHGASGRLPPEHRDLEQQVYRAMLRYYERDSLLHAHDPRSVCFPDAIHATTQCRPYRLAIWMVSRGRSLLPWHGVGVVDRRGKWGVALAREVLGDPSYQSVFLDGEDTPFFYRQVG